MSWEERFLAEGEDPAMGRALDRWEAWDLRAAAFFDAHAWVGFAILAALVLLAGLLDGPVM